MSRVVSKKNIMALLMSVCILFAGFGVTSASAQTRKHKKHRALKRVGIGTAIGAGAGGLIGGRKGAAAKLGCNRTTLIHKMKKLGIARPAPEGREDLLGPAPRRSATLPQLQ